MNASIIALEEDCVDLGKKSRNVWNDLDAVFGADLLGKPVDSIGGLRNILAATFHRSDNAQAGDFSGVEYLGERRNMRGIGTNDTDANVRGEGRKREQ